MQKKIIVILLSVFFSQVVYAQINYGIKFGMNYSKVTSTNNFTGIEIVNINKFKLGFHIGLVAKIPISKKISINAELLYSDKGSANNKGEKSSYYEFNLYYIDLPIIVNYELAESLFFQIGIEPGFLSSSNFVDYYKEGILDYNPFDFEMLFGLEYHMKKVGMGVRYQQSVIPIFSSEYRSAGGENQGTVKLYNKNIQLYFTYLFRSN